MKTTLDLPEDVALTLRLESARRGGRRVASYSKLVADAVRQVYSSGNITQECRLELVEGRVLVHAPEAAKPVSSEDVQNALDEL